MRRRLSFLMPSPAMAVALAALLAVSTGWAVAATSHSSVIRACAEKKRGALRLANKCRRNERFVFWNQQGQRGLTGPQGPRGRVGATGANGTNGINGTNGSTGFTATLPKGATEEGTWAIAIPTANAGGVSSISFNIPLAARPLPKVIAKGGPSTAACPGTVAAPAAASGNLCIYTSTSDHIAEFAVYDPSVEGGLTNTAGPWGITVSAATGATTPGVAYGTWAVTG